MHVMQELRYVMHQRMVARVLVWEMHTTDLEIQRHDEAKQLRHQNQQFILDMHAVK
jgi:hypothetical protein